MIKPNCSEITVRYTLYFKSTHNVMQLRFWFRIRKRLSLWLFRI